MSDVRRGLSLTLPGTRLISIVSYRESFVGTTLRRLVPTRSPRT
jgi:hypothetical protein